MNHRTGGIYSIGEDTHSRNEKGVRNTRNKSVGCMVNTITIAAIQGSIGNALMRALVKPALRLRCF